MEKEEKEEEKKEKDDDMQPTTVLDDDEEACRAFLWYPVVYNPFGKDMGDPEAGLTKCSHVRF